jgi:hypothetical protein
MSRTPLPRCGVPITYVSAQLGHADPTTTLTWYALPPKATARYVDLLDGGAANVPSQPLAPLSADEEEENESLTAKATEGTSSAPRVIRTPDLLIRSPFGHSYSSIRPDIRERSFSDHGIGRVSRFTPLRRASYDTSITALTDGAPSHPRSGPHETAPSWRTPRP